MTPHPTLRLLAATLSSLGLVGALHAAPLNTADHRSAKDGVGSTYDTEREHCKSVKGNARDVCQAEARMHQQVALAELEHRQSGKGTDAVKVAMARADGAFAVAKERCDDQSGQAKSLCRTQASTAHTKAKADAKLATAVSEARSDAVDDKAGADRKLAEARCEALAGAARTDCDAAVKTRFAKP